MGWEEEEEGVDEFSYQILPGLSAEYPEEREREH